MMLRLLSWRWDFGKGLVHGGQRPGDRQRDPDRPRGGAPRAPALGCYRGRQRRALADAEPAHRPWAASGEAGAPRVPAAAAASDETVACGEGAAAGDEKARGPEEVAAAGTRRVDSTSPIQLEASLNVADSYAVAG